MDLIKKKKKKKPWKIPNSVSIIIIIIFFLMLTVPGSIFAEMPKVHSMGARFGDIKERWFILGLFTTLI